MKFLGLLAGCWLIFLSSLIAQDYTVIKTSFTPAVYYVGDKVEMRISLQSAFAPKMTLPHDLPPSSWGRISSAQLLKNGEEPELRLVFISYQSGTHRLPAINLGPVILEDINIYVSSTLDNKVQNLQLAQSREQMAIPFSLVILLGQLLLALLGLIGIFWLLRLGRNFWQGFWRQRGDLRPFKLLMKSLKTAELNIQGLDAWDFYDQILSAGRLYIAQRLLFNAPSATSREISEFLLGLAYDPEKITSLIACFEHGDQVKFAGLKNSPQARMSDLSNLALGLRYIEQNHSLIKLMPARVENNYVES